MTPPDPDGGGRFGASGAGTGVDGTTAAMALALLGCPGLGQAAVEASIEACGGIAGAFESLAAGDTGAAARSRGRRTAQLAEIADHLRRTDLAALERALTRLDAMVLVRGEPGYPTALAAVDDPPPVLVVAGLVELLALPAVAVVGTRKASMSGIRVAQRLGGEIAEAGVAVVSGLALGVDAAAHQGALEAASAGGASTIAVLGCGLDVAYPRRNRDLYRRIAESGLLVSQFGLGIAPERWRFPVRNRTIAGLSAGVVVVEAHASGGALSTAAAAREIGREVMAVPGTVENPASVGTFELLRDGASPVACAADALFASGLSDVTVFAEYEAGRPGATAPSDELAGDAARVAVLLADREARSPFELADVLALEVRAVMNALGRLVALGAVERVGEGLFAATPTHRSRSTSAAGER